MNLPKGRRVWPRLGRWIGIALVAAAVGRVSIPVEECVVVSPRFPTAIVVAVKTWPWQSTRTKLPPSGAPLENPLDLRRFLSPEMRTKPLPPTVDVTPKPRLKVPTEKEAAWLRRYIGEARAAELGYEWPGPERLRPGVERFKARPPWARWFRHPFDPIDLPEPWCRGRVVPHVPLTALQAVTFGAVGAALILGVRHK